MIYEGHQARKAAARESQGRQIEQEEAGGTSAGPQETGEGQAQEEVRGQEDDGEAGGAWWAEPSRTKQKTTEWPRILGAPAREGGRVRQQVADLDERIQADREAAGCGRATEERATRGAEPGRAEAVPTASPGATWAPNANTMGAGPAPTKEQGTEEPTAAEDQGRGTPEPPTDQEGGHTATNPGDQSLASAAGQIRQQQAPDTCHEHEDGANEDSADEGNSWWAAPRRAQRRTVAWPRIMGAPTRVVKGAQGQAEESTRTTQEASPAPRAGDEQGHPEAARGPEDIQSRPATSHLNTSSPVPTTGHEGTPLAPTGRRGRIGTTDSQGNTGLATPGDIECTGLVPDGDLGGTDPAPTEDHGGGHPALAKGQGNAKQAKGPVGADPTLPTGQEGTNHEQASTRPAPAASRLIPSADSVAEIEFSILDWRCLCVLRAPPPH